MENWILTWTKLKELSNSNVNAITNNIAGVYRFSYLSDEGSYYIFYVGKTEDIKNRLLNHLLSSEENFCIKNYLASKRCFFRYAMITKAYIRDAAEKQMYKQYEPSCNEKEPEGREDVKVNLS